MSLVIDIRLLDAHQGGLDHAISNGYRPLCIVKMSDAPEVVIGLCELLLDTDLAPGDSTQGELVFDHDVADEVRRYLSVGTEFALAEGRREIGTAVVVKGIG